jgi:DNA polymerase elongation subunit (family B)
MSFYTSVELLRNRIMYRGYNDSGHRIEQRLEFKPQLFVPTQDESDWRTLDEKPVEPITFASPGKMNEWVRDKEELRGFNYYGCEKAITQFIQRKFPGEIKFNKDHMRIINFDIEVHSEDGFPYPETAEHPVVAITAKDSRSSVYHVWGLKDYDPSKSPHKHLMIQYHKCKNEVELLYKFGKFWQDDYPDVVTGWNIRFFDIPYLINRINRLAGGKEEVAAHLLSPWNEIRTKTVSFKNKTMESYQIYGVNQMDYFDIFQKLAYSYPNQESYALDHIAHVVLGERKMSYEEYGSLRSLYNENPQLYIDYNIKDVELVERIDEKLDLMYLAIFIAYIAGTNYQDVFGTTAIWDSIVYRELTKKKYVVPAMGSRDKRGASSAKFAGGYVKDVNPGLYDWVVSYDLASLYPNIIAEWNMSPETLLDQPAMLGTNGPDHYLENKPDLPGNYSCAANGTFYRNDVEGTFPSIVKLLYDDRKRAKRLKIEAEQRYEKTKDKAEESVIAQAENHQMAVKILLNSLFGAIGNKWYRYFDLRVAEGITLTGQLVIRWCEREMNKQMNKVIGTEDVDYVIAIDTDSLYVDYSKMIEKFNPKDPVSFLSKVGHEHFETAFKKSMEELHEHMNTREQRMEMEREVIADRGIWQAKKRYILNLHDKEGVRYEEPKLKIMGIEAIKSSTPQVCRDWMKELFPVMMRGTEEQVQEFIKKKREEFREMAPHEIGMPRGMSDMDKWLDRDTLYKKGVPIHVRGAILFNHWVKEKGLSNQYELIKNGAKLKFVHLKMPNPIRENVIAFPNYLPPELGLHEYIDYDHQFEKTFLDPIDLILQPIGWRHKKTSSLEGNLA